MDAPRTKAGRAAMEFLQTRAWREAILAIEAEARADALRGAADRVRAIHTHEVGGYEFDWKCLPVTEGPFAGLLSEDCGDYDAHNRLIDSAAVLAILDPQP